MNADAPNKRVELGLGGIALILAVTTVILSVGNRDLQQKLTDGQAKVARVQALSNLDNNLIQLLAKSAMDNKDDALRQLLESNGITFKAGTSSGPAPVANEEKN